MASRAFEAAVRRQMEDGLATDLTLASHLSEIVGALKAGEKFEKGFVDFVFQKWKMDAPDVYDAFVASMIFAAVEAGRLASIVIDVGVRPQSDKQIEWNKAALARLPRPFAARLWCGTSDSDGAFSWDAEVELPVRVGTEKCLGDPCTCATEMRSFAAGEVDLEIGTTSSFTSLEHIWSGGGLARWAYGSKDIYLVVATTEWKKRCREDLAALVTGKDDT